MAHYRKRSSIHEDDGFLCRRIPVCRPAPAERDSLPEDRRVRRARVEHECRSQAILKRLQPWPERKLAAPVNGRYAVPLARRALLRLFPEPVSCHGAYSQDELTLLIVSQAPCSA